MDDTPDSIYRAVGYAISKWETLEAHLSFLYSIFEGKPLDVDALETFGKDNRIFRDRIGSLRDSAENFFTKSPNQELEAKVDCWLREAQRLADIRHRIAHGLVVRTDVEIGAHRLVPPTHGIFHLTKKDGYYAYSSGDIEAFVGEFMRLAAAVQAFNHSQHQGR